MKLTLKLHRIAGTKQHNSGTLTKLLRVMRLTTVLIVVCCVHVSAKTVSQTITYTGQDTPLEKIFSIVKEQTGYVFFYNSDLIEKAKPVTIKAEDMPLEKFLQTILQNQPLEWQLVNGTIVISRKLGEQDGKDGGKIQEDSLRVFSGTVRSPLGPLAGASVVIRGTNKGTYTTAEGTFSLRVSENENVLIISSVGHEGQEYRITGLQVLHAVLMPLINKLDEAVVIGYGSTTNRLNTGSVSRITAKELAVQPVANSLAAMAGRMAGVYISQQTGVPGGNFAIQIRGRNSLRDEGNHPLYIVDGVPYANTTLSSSFASGSIVQMGNPLNSINPSDIESIEVLKDADATSIYGSRGANGVVLITTKKGKGVKTQVVVDFSAGWGRLTRKMKLLDAKDYLAMRHEGFLNDGAAHRSTDFDVNGTWDTTRSTDWQQELLGETAKLTNAQVSLSGGNEMTRFVISAAHRYESTVFPGRNGNERSTAHLNLNHSSKDEKFRVQVSALLSKEVNTLPQADLTNVALTLAPVAPALYTPNGELNWENSTWENPLARLLRKYNGESTGIVGNAVISYELFRGLVAKTSFGYSQSLLEEISTNPANSFRPSIGIKTSSSIHNTGNFSTSIIEPQLSYQFKYRDAAFELLAGATAQHDKRNTLTMLGSGFTTTDLLSNLQAAPELSVIASAPSEYRYAGWYCRINLNYQKTFLLNLTGRRDGSSRFAPGRRFGNFGAAGAAIIFSNFPWIKQLNFLSFGKIRGSYGTSGNDLIGEYQYLNSYSPSPYPYEGISGLLPVNLYHPDYSWERNKKAEAGLELGFAKDRLLLNVSYYQSSSSNQLVGYYLPPTTGFSSVQSNFPATVRNTGWEADLTGLITKGKRLQWNAGFNISFPRNKLVAFPEIKNSFYDFQYEVGKSLLIRKVFHVTGIDPTTGIYLLEDVDQNGSGTDFPADLQGRTDLAPRFHGGLQNSIRYQRLQLDVFFQFVKQQGYNYMTSFSRAPGRLSNQAIWVMDRWRSGHENAPVQKFTSGANGDAGAAFNNAVNAGDLVFDDASFVRLKNVSIAYDLPLLKKLPARSAKIYVQGQNLLMITRYKGMDPENNGAVRLPPLSMIVTGIQLTF